MNVAKKEVENMQSLASIDLAKGGIEKPIDIPDLLNVDPQVILKLDGSNTIGAKLAPALADAYLVSLGAVATVVKQLEQPNEVQVVGYLPENARVVAIEIKAHGSSTGFKTLVNEETDIAMSSRGIKEQENLDLLLQQGDMTEPASEHIIALDGLAIIKNPNNPISSLNVEQLADVFSGKITNWSELGGENRPISLYARDQNSGTFDTFNALVLSKMGVELSQAYRYESNENLAQAVRSDINAIGFTGLAYANNDLLIDVAAAAGLPAIKPKQFTVSSEDYALSRRLYLYANHERSKNEHVKNFIEFAKSNQAQKYVEQVQFIPQKITTTSPYVDSAYPAAYRQIASQGERISMTFRLRADRAEIDNKSAQDLAFLVEYLADRPSSKITLIGFSAGESNDEEKDKNRALIRSRILASELRLRGVTNVEVISLGSQLPIDSNGSELGRYKNNRTEIWLLDEDKTS